jgi:lipoyl(octanoyl) transferase
MNHPVRFQDLGKMSYKQAWDYQESLMQNNVRIKSRLREMNDHEDRKDLKTVDHLLFVEHPPVFTLGRSGNISNVLLSQELLQRNGIEFFQTNRGGDITFHGPEQIVGYPILDLEKYGTDIGKYMRNLEEVIILTLAEYGIRGQRSAGETGVWIDPEVKGRERKICALGIRCSRWITMHGFALNVNTDLSYFNFIIPCGIQGKQVSSMERELGGKVDMDGVKASLRKNFSRIFDADLIEENFLQASLSI